MLGVSDYGAFVLAFILLLLLPGPGNLALVTSTGLGGGVQVCGRCWACCWATRCCCG